MAYTIKYGPSGSGKTLSMINYIKSNKNDIDLIITDSKSISGIEGVMANNNIACKCLDILSLPEYILEDLGDCTDTRCSRELASTMLAQILIEENDNLRIFKDISFDNNIVYKLLSLIIEFNNNNIFAENINDLFESGTPIVGSFYDKLHDIKILSGKLNSKLLDKGYTFESVLLLKALNKIENAPAKCYKNIIVDTLTEYSNNTIKLIAYLGLISENVIVMISVPNKSTDNILSANYKVIDDIASICKEKDIFVTKEELALSSITSTYTPIADGIQLISSEFFNLKNSKTLKDDSVSLFEASTPIKEIEYICSEIKRLIDSGYKYDDIIVASPAIDIYYPLIQNNFNINNIPFYYYKNNTLKESQLYQFIIQIFALTDSFTLDKIASMVHLNLTKLSNSDIFLLDSFHKRFGDNVEIALKNCEIYDSDTFIGVKGIIDTIRAQINEFKDTLNICSSVSDYVLATTEMLYNMSVPEAFNTDLTNLSSGNEFQLCNEIIDIWNSMVTCFENLNEVFGDIDCSKEYFLSLLNRYCSDTRLINKKQYYNEIVVMDVSSLPSTRINALFVIGCNEKYMFNTKDNDIFSDKEKKILNSYFETDIKISDKLYSKQIYDFYSALTTPYKFLSISWASFDFSYSPLSLSPYIENIKNMFIDNLKNDETYVQKIDETNFIAFLSALSEYIKTGIMTADFMDSFNYFKTHPMFKYRLYNAIKNVNLDRRNILTDVTSSYKKFNEFSATRLEVYNDCPFKHFVRFGLSPRAQKMFQETVANKGTFYHDVFFNVYTEILDKKLDIKKITEAEVNDIVNNVIDDYLEKHNDSLLTSSDKYKYISNQMRQVSLVAVWNSILQLKAGSFVPVFLEHDIGEKIPFEFTLDNGDVVDISGITDRIDVTEVGGEKYARVIDYKSGSTVFDLNKFHAGLQLQLPLYLCSTTSEYKPAGMYYFKIHNPITDVDNLSSDDFKQFQLSGYTNSDSNVLMATDPMIFDEDVRSSNVVSVSLTTKGDLSKSSKVMDDSDMLKFLNEAENIAKQTITNIRNGNTLAKPTFSDNYSACDFCDFKAFCHFDITLADSYNFIKN